VLAAECKANLDKTMFQEARATASALKQGCPIARYGSVESGGVRLWWCRYGVEC